MGKHTHVIEADSLDEFKSEVGALAQSLGIGGTSPAPASAAVEENPVDAKAGKGKGKGKSSVKASEIDSSDDAAEAEVAPAKKATAKAAPVVEDDPFASDEAEEEITFDSVNKALEQVGKEKGIAEVREILAKFGEKKVSAVKEKDYPSLMQAIKESLE